MQIDHELLLKLWDKAVGTLNYDKRRWSDVSNQILFPNPGTVSSSSHWTDPESGGHRKTEIAGLKDSTR